MLVLLLTMWLHRMMLAVGLTSASFTSHTHRIICAYAAGSFAYMHAHLSIRRTGGRVVARSCAGHACCKRASPQLLLLTSGAERLSPRHAVRKTVTMSPAPPSAQRIKAFVIPHHVTDGDAAPHPLLPKQTLSTHPTQHNRCTTSNRSCTGHAIIICMVPGAAYLAI